MPERYEKQPGDPPWLVRLGEFHGHLGPWVVIGYLMGADARQRLDTPGYFDIEVICRLSPEYQRQPWSCILDGLQVGTGATMGKQNIRFEPPLDAESKANPVVHIIRRASGSRAAAGVEYRLSGPMRSWLAGITPARTEEMSREVAAKSPAELFEIRAVDVPADKP